MSADLPPQPAPQLAYSLRLTGNAPDEEPLPLIVAIHWMGSSPDACFDDLLAGFERPARVVLPQGLLPYKEGWTWFPDSYYRDGVAAQAAILHDTAEQVATLIDGVTNLYPTVGLPVVMGYSQGGDLSYTIATHYPTLVAGALPLGALFPPALWPEPADDTPYPFIHAFHGAADPIVPIAEARAIIAALSKCGLPTYLHEYPAVGHDYPPQMRRDVFAALAELLQWGSGR